ncbi:helix-turn-helix domain-containing protein [Sphingobacterium pedocola]|uniref:Helix-turn-helix domain-containing protein n=1 Tax=Sphingobacterium pedocola TaxID=2082722 RepID=A0ABR9T754_9SPHI|nr:helix-turn-helix domain-containing protein [Sphingobacterium pedocola]MBE8721163.1 hypothetical protein [Sphingobacterium pedocola]
MEDYLHRLYLTLKRMHELMENISSNTDLMADKKDQGILLRDDVIKYLRISERTYKRYVNQGKLTPHRIGNIDTYRKEDIEPLYNDRKRRGHI